MLEASNFFVRRGGHNIGSQKKNMGLGELFEKTLWYLLSLLNSLLLPPQPAGCVTATPLLLLLSKNKLRIF